MSNGKHFRKVFPIKKSPKVKTIRNATADYAGVIEEINGNFGLIDPAGKFKFIAPEDSQRPESWSDEDRVKYFTSILNDSMEGNLIFVNLKFAAATLEELGTAHDQILLQKYQQYLAQGFRHLVLDGHNRIAFLTRLITDQYAIPKGTYTYILDKGVKTITIGTNQYFSQLKAEVQELILNREIVISEYTQIDEQGQADVFEAANSGCPPNHQELRNVRQTPWSGWIRSISKNNPDLCVNARGKNYKHRLKGDEWLAQTINLALSLKFVEEGQKVQPVTQVTMNKMYFSDYLQDDEVEFYEANFNLLDNWMERLSKEEDLSSDMLPPAFMQNLFWMMINGLSDYEEAVEAAKMHHKAKSSSRYVDDEGNNFAWACGGTGRKHNELRLNVLRDIFTELDIPVETM